MNTPGVTTFNLVPSGGGGIYNFKTIQIASGSTLRLSGAVVPGPLYFLATGAVTVSGTIDLSGQDGVQPNNAVQRTGPSTPGSGGFGGGSAAYQGLPALAGLGPLGGATNFVNACPYTGGGGGGISANQFLVPLIGGSGGAGFTGSGGGGGGALLIASSVSITVNGSINAKGGNGSNYSGGGGGGSLRLVAPLIAGNGSLAAQGGFGGMPNCGPPNDQGATGIVRLEFYQFTYTGPITGTYYSANPVNLFLPAPSTVPTIMVTSIGNATVGTIPVPPNPTGSFAVPDVLLNSSSPLTVNIAATNIPPNTVPILYFATENFPDQKISASPLSGTTTSSTATATVTLNAGYSLGFVTATWVH